MGLTSVLGSPGLDSKGKDLEKTEDEGYEETNISSKLKTSYREVGLNLYIPK